MRIVKIICLMLTFLSFSEGQKRDALFQSDDHAQHAERSLLQNPDKPALGKYGGVNMTSKCRLSCCFSFSCQLGVIAAVLYLQLLFCIDHTVYERCAVHC